jgi:hypothetical protein
LCFATLNTALTQQERKGITRLARKGRRSLRTGQQVNPVLVLTGAELLGHGEPRRVAERLPERFRQYIPSQTYLKFLLVTPMPQGNDT